METKSWKVDLDGASHDVTLRWSYWGGKRAVEVDGNVVDESTIPMRWKSTQAFDLAGHPAVVETRPSRRFSAWFAIALRVDGQEVEPQPGFSRWEAPPA